VFKVRVADLERLQVMRLHVFEESDVDTAAARVVGLGEAPAHDAGDEAQGRNEDDRLRERRRP
jgi:hypothetical protein